MHLKTIRRHYQHYKKKRLEILFTISHPLTPKVSQKPKQYNITKTKHNSYPNLICDYFFLVFYINRNRFEVVNLYEKGAERKSMEIQEESSCIYKNPDAPVEARVEDLLSRMTLPEKIGQMTQIERAVTTPAVIAESFIGIRTHPFFLLSKKNIFFFFKNKKKKNIFYPILNN